MLATVYCMGKRIQKLVSVLLKATRCFPVIKLQTSIHMDPPSCFQVSLLLCMHKPCVVIRTNFKLFISYIKHISLHGHNT